MDSGKEPAVLFSNSDRPHRVVLYGLYELPFGAGKPWLSNGDSMVSQIFGGWQVNWIGTFQSGEPLQFQNPGADRITVSDNNPHTVDEWFDLTQFRPREPFTLRTLPTRLGDLLPLFDARRAITRGGNDALRDDATAVRELR